MLNKVLDQLGITATKEISYIIELLKIAGNSDDYQKLISDNADSLFDYEQRSALLKLGMFNKQDFLMLIFSFSEGTGIESIAIGPTLQRLIDWGLVIDQTLFGNNAYVNYMWNHERINYCNYFNITDNILLGSSYVANKYQASVPAVSVKKNGDSHAGTGFLIRLNNSNNKSFILTAKHNVDPGENIVFDGLISNTGKPFKPINSEWILHQTLDLALLEVEHDSSHIPIYPLAIPLILSRTITLGYPAIATTDNCYLLAHGGELNAVVNTYYKEQRLIISNLVAPGNSGGPVLDETGLCLGIVVNSFETEHLGGVEKASSAIPATAIVDFVKPYFE